MPRGAALALLGLLLSSTPAHAKTVADRVNAVAAAPDLKTALRRTVAIPELRGRRGDRDLLRVWERWRLHGHPKGTPWPKIVVKSRALTIGPSGQVRLVIRDQLAGGGDDRSNRPVDLRLWKLRAAKTPHTDVEAVMEAFPELKGAEGPRVLAEKLREILNLR